MHFYFNSVVDFFSLSLNEDPHSPTCWVSCQLCQLLIILFTAPIVLHFTLVTLFAEPRLGKTQAKRLEEDARSHRNCEHISSLLAGMAAIA